MGLDDRDVVDLLEGRATITIQVGKQLADILGASPEFWVTRDAQYRADAARLQGEGRKWLRALPLTDMIGFGWLVATPSPSEELSECLMYFGVKTVFEWQDRYARILNAAAYKTSRAFDSHPAAVATWLRQGEIHANAIQCEPWDSRRFRASLDAIRELTRIADPNEFLPALAEACKSSGVAVVVVRAPTGCRASGAAMFIDPKKAMILLSFRYLTDDQFWFTFFHEAAHLLLHDRDQVFLEDLEPMSEQQEDEANAFSEDVLIPLRHKEEFLGLQPELRAILRYAKKVGVSAGIVVGQLQHVGRLPPHHFNNLKTRYHWTDQLLKRR